MSTRAERLALLVWLTGVRSLSIGRDSREVRRQRHPHDEDAVAATSRDLCATTSRVTRKPEVRRRGAKTRRRRGAATARRDGVGQGRPARCPGQRTSPRLVGELPGEPSLARVPRHERSAYRPAERWGAAMPRAPSSARARWSVARPEAEPTLGTRPAGLSERLARAQRGAPPLET